jgi:phospholipid/cholesterol/gamma-HCH transport system substrate-binding protein
MRAGALTALVAAVIAVGVIVVGAGGAERTYTAEFSDVRGLVAGAPVRVAGVGVGEVGRIRLGADGWPRVQLRLDGDLSLHATATAAVRLGSLSGEYNRYVSIVQGTGPALPDGAVLPRAQTRSPVELDDALGTFDAPTREQIRTIMGGLRAALGGRGAAIAATLRDSQAALDEVTAAAADVGDDGAAVSSALRSGRVIAATLAARTRQLGSTIDTAESLLHVVAGRARTVAGAVGGLPAGLDAVRGALVRARADLGPARRLVAAASPLAAELPATAGEAGAALRAARPALAQAAALTRAAPAAARALGPLLAEAGPLLAVTTRVLNGLGPMLDELRVRFPDAFSFFANWADFTSNYDANGHGARVGIVLAPAPTNALTPSSDGAGQLKPPYLRTPGAMDGQPWTGYAKSFLFKGRPG